jgi:hypothetical protein
MRGMNGLLEGALPKCKTTKCFNFRKNHSDSLASSLATTVAGC